MCCITNVVKYVQRNLSHKISNTRTSTLHYANLAECFFHSIMITKLQNLPIHDWISAIATSKDKFVHYILIYRHIFCRNILIDNEIFENKPCMYASIPNISIASI